MRDREKEKRAKRAAYQREWLAAHPEMRDKLNAAVRERRRIKKGLLPQAEIPDTKFNTLGEPQTPTEKHVVLSRLLRRLLQEAYDRGYLTVEVTNDDTAYEMRVKAALDVSQCLAQKIEESSEADGTEG